MVGLKPDPTYIFRGYEAASISSMIATARSLGPDLTWVLHDLASLHRAVTSFLQDCCSESRELGSCGSIHTMRDLFETLKGLYTRNMQPGAPTFQRVPIDVEEEGSFVTNVLHLATDLGFGDLVDNQLGSVNIINARFGKGRVVDVGNSEGLSESPA